MVISIINNRMEWNQPFEKLAFDSNPYNVYHQTIPSYTRVKGEGEVKSIFFPDGSMQMYFTPTVGHDRWSPYQCNAKSPNTGNFQKNMNTEYWLIRSIACPISTGYNNQLPNIYGDRLSTQAFSPDYSTNLAYCPEYYQKFHNDNSTSTTDILYFYPSLRQERTSQNCALVQTNIPTSNCNISYEGVNKRPCNCKVSFRVEEKETNDKCVCKKTASSMSVDSVKSKTGHSIKNKKIKLSSTKYKSKSNRRKNNNHICECNAMKDTSDKLVTTYVDRASGSVRREGRDTQTTQRSKRNSIKTEIWIPIKRKSRTIPNPSITSLSECASCCNSVDSSCASGTETGDQ